MGPSGAMSAPSPRSTRPRLGRGHSSLTAPTSTRARSSSSATGWRRGPRPPGRWSCSPSSYRIWTRWPPSTGATCATSSSGPATGSAWEALELVQFAWWDLSQPGWLRAAEWVDGARRRGGGAQHRSDQLRLRRAHGSPGRRDSRGLEPGPVLAAGPAAAEGHDRPVSPARRDAARLRGARGRPALGFGRCPRAVALARQVPARRR